MKILITTKTGELLFQYDSFTERREQDNVLVTGLISAIVALSNEVVSSFPREIDFQSQILYFYQENDYIAALLVDTDSPFNANIVPILLAEFKKIQEKYQFPLHQAMKYEEEITRAIKNYLAYYLANIQRNMVSILDSTELKDYKSVIKLKHVARDQSSKRLGKFLSIELICRMIPDGLDKILFGLVVGIPIVITGNRSIVEPVIQTFRLLCPTRILQVKFWSEKYTRGYDLLGTNDVKTLVPSNNLICVNIDEGIVFGGKASKYFSEIECQVCNLNTMEAFSFLRTELEWIFEAFEKLSIDVFSRKTLTLEKQLILFELLNRLQ